MTATPQMARRKAQVEWDGISLAQLRDEIAELITRCGEDAKLDIEAWEEYGSGAYSMHFRYETMETPDEAERREAQSLANAADQRAFDLRQLAELKRKLGETS